MHLVNRIGERYVCCWVWRVSVDIESTLNLTLLVGRVTATSLPPERITLRQVLEAEDKAVLVDCKVISGLSVYHSRESNIQKDLFRLPKNCANMG